MRLEIRSRMKSKLPYAAIFAAFFLVSILVLPVVNIIRPINNPAINYIPLEETRNSASNIIFIMLGIFGFTGLILFLRKHHKRSLQSMYFVFLFLIDMMLLNYFSTLLDLWHIPRIAALTIASLLDAAITVLLIKTPEWYIIDLVGILLAADASMTLGMSLSVPLLIVFLSAMAIYDAISVYKTKHMIDLADSTVRIKLPLMLFIPKIRNFRMNFLDNMPDLREQKQRKREVFILGLGDIVLPISLVASAFFSMNLTVSISTLLGTFLGLAVLEYYVSKGRPHAGLPFLCSGAILGCITSILLLKIGI